MSKNTQIRRGRNEDNEKFLRIWPPSRPSPCQPTPPRPWWRQLVVNGDDTSLESPWAGDELERQRSDRADIVSYLALVLHQMSLIILQYTLKYRFLEKSTIFLHFPKMLNLFCKKEGGRGARAVWIIKNFWAAPPPPPFGQCLKENIFPRGVTNTLWYTSIYFGIPQR